MSNRSFPLHIVLLIAGLAILFPTVGHGQINVRDSIVRTPMIAVSYSAHSAGGDLADRYGSSSMIGGEYTFKSDHNWLFTVRAEFLFGSVVKETSIFDSLMTNSGNLLSSQGTYSEIFTYERGWHFSGRVGKLFPIFGPNPNSGLRIDFGLGYFLHKIRIEDRDNVTPQLGPEYRKGYDRLTAGFATSQFIGYHHQDNKRRFNFFAGFDFVQGFTSNQRSWNFDERKKDTTQRVDLLYGFKVGFIIPIYPKSKNSSRYYIN